MARVGFIMSMILTLLGVVLLSIGLLVHALLPKVGYMAFRIGGGSYSPTDYEPSAALWLHHALAVGCIIVGSMLSARFYGADQK
jgi:hypothetical protein